MPPFLIFPGTFPLDLTLFTTSPFSFPSPSHSLSSRFGTPFTHQWECEGTTFRPRHRTTPKTTTRVSYYQVGLPDPPIPQASTRLPTPTETDVHHDGTIDCRPVGKHRDPRGSDLSVHRLGSSTREEESTRSLFSCDGFVSYLRTAAVSALFCTGFSHCAQPTQHSTPSSSVPKPTSFLRPTAQTNRSSFLAPPAACVYQQSRVQARHIHEKHDPPATHLDRPSFSPLLSSLVDGCANISILFCSSIASFFLRHFHRQISVESSHDLVIW